VSARPEDRTGAQGSRSSDADVLAWVERVAPRTRWTGLRGLDLVRPGLEAEALVAAYRTASTEPDATVATVVRGGEPAAAAIRRPKPMETDSFGLSTAAVNHLVCPPETEGRLEVLRALSARLCADAADDGVELLLLRVDADDVEALSAAQSAGFHVHEATITHLADAEGAAPPVLPAGLEVEVHEADVTSALTRDEVERLAAATARWELNHFHADPRLPRDGVRRFYSQWVHNIASGRWSDCLNVARRDGRVVGIQSELSDRELRAATGVDVRVGEWILVLEPGTGAGSALMAVAGRHRHPGGTHHSWETQLRNLATLRCIQQTGVARPIRSGYTLHAWPRRG